MLVQHTERSLLLIAIINELLRAPRKDIDIVEATQYMGAYSQPEVLNLGGSGHAQAQRAWDNRQPLSLSFNYRPDLGGSVIAAAFAAQYPRYWKQRGYSPNGKVDNGSVTPVCDFHSHFFDARPDLSRKSASI